MSRDRTSKFQLMLVMAAILAFMGFNLIGCEPTKGELTDAEWNEENEALDGLNEEDLESQSYAITGLGLPNGCSGGEQRHTISYPMARERDGNHLRLIFLLPNENWCWISVHGRVNTNLVQGGADNWADAVLRNDYYSNGRDRLEVMVPKTFWMPYYSYYRWVIGFSRSQAYDQVANLFWVWGYSQ